MLEEEMKAFKLVLMELEGRRTCWETSSDLRDHYCKLGNLASQLRC